MNRFLLVASNVESVSGGCIPARVIVGRRLTALKWPLFKNTPHQREISKGDELIVYLAGSKERCFVATATVEGVGSSRNYDADGVDALTNAPFQTLLLVNAQWLRESIQIANIRDALDFVPKNTNKWGCVLQRGLKKISKEDADRILSRHSS